MNQHDSAADEPALSGFLDGLPTKSATQLLESRKLRGRELRRKWLRMFRRRILAASVVGFGAAVAMVGYSLLDGSNWRLILYRGLVVGIGGPVFGGLAAIVGIWALLIQEMKSDIANQVLPMGSEESVLGDRPWRYFRWIVYVAPCFTGAILAGNEKASLPAFACCLIGSAVSLRALKAWGDRHDRCRKRE